MNIRRVSTVAIGVALCIGCTDPATSPAASPPIDRLLIFVRDLNEDVTLHLTRNAGGSTVVLFRQASPGRPRIVLDSVGPGPKSQEPEEIRAMLASFDVWALNEPNAPGAACRTVNGQRSCAITLQDYSLVMQVERGGEIRVQRYTGLERSTSNKSARALADFVFAWARKREASGQARPPG
jgi:hypothetical protein